MLENPQVFVQTSGANRLHTLMVNPSILESFRNLKPGLLALLAHSSVSKESFVERTQVMTKSGVYYNSLRKHSLSIAANLAPL